MILVMLGTNPYNFHRLASAMDAYAAHTEEDVFIQLGHTEYIPIKAKFQRFIERNELLIMIAAAELIVTQGGCGSIADSLIAGKPVVAVPRKPELKEAPDRQEELVRELEKLGRLVGVYEISELPEAIEKAKTAVFKQGARHRIPEIIDRFIKVC